MYSCFFFKYIFFNESLYFEIQSVIFIAFYNIYLTTEYQFSDETTMNNVNDTIENVTVTQIIGCKYYVGKRFISVFKINYQTTKKIN